MKVNDIVTMQYQALWWNKGAVGHIVRIDHDTQGNHDKLYIHRLHKIYCRTYCSKQQNI